MPVGDETGQSVLPALKETVEGEAVILTGWRAWRPSQPDMLQSLTKTVHWPARDVVGQCLGRGTRGSARQRVEVCAAHLDQLALDKMADIFALFGYIKTHNPPLFVPFFEGGEFIPVKLAASELSLTGCGQAVSFWTFFDLTTLD